MNNQDPQAHTRNAFSQQNLPQGRDEQAPPSSGGTPWTPGQPSTPPAGAFARPMSMPSGPNNQFAPSFPLPRTPQPAAPAGTPGWQMWSPPTNNPAPARSIESDSQPGWQNWSYSSNPAASPSGTAIPGSEPDWQTWAASVRQSGTPDKSSISDSQPGWQTWSAPATPAATSMPGNQMSMPGWPAQNNAPTPQGVPNFNHQLANLNASPPQNIAPAPQNVSGFNQQTGNLNWPAPNNMATPQSMPGFNQQPATFNRPIPNNPTIPQNMPGFTNPSTAPDWSTRQNMSGAQNRSFAQSAQPSFVAPPQQHRHSRKRLGKGKILLLAALVVLIVVGGIFVPGLIQQITDAASTPQLGHTGPFVQTPFNAQQVSDIHHLTSHMKARQLASLYVARMGLDEELGQLFMVQYGSQVYTPDLDTMINQQHVGGIIMYASQINTIAQTKADTGQMQARASIPLLIGIDEEGSNVTRINKLYPYPTYTTADSIHKSGDPAVASSEGQKVAQHMLSVGINVDFAPDVDVAPLNSYIDWDYRAFGSTVDDVIKYAGPYMRAMQQAGGIAALKHFPGLGDISRLTDPHSVLPVVTHTKDQIYNVDMAPFKHFIDSSDPLDHPGFIMPTDVMMPAIDPKMPAEFSHIFITDILRKEMGYDGVVITDSLHMEGVEVNGVHLTPSEASLLALNAGDDMLLDINGSTELAGVVSDLKTAIQNGALTKQRVDEAATRIIALKIERHLLPALAPAA